MRLEATRVRLSPLARISMGLVSLTAFLLLIADLAFHVFPDDVEIARQVRKRVSESAAIQLTSLVQKGDFETIQRTMDGVAARENEILSLAVRRSDGQLVAQTGEHAQHWVAPSGGNSTLTHVLVPVFSGKDQWGQIEISYRPATPRSILGWLTHPLAIIMYFVVIGGFLAYYWYMRRVLEHLDPTAVIPDRVRTALDTLSEGVIILDPQGRIVLANSRFRALVPKSEKTLLARRASDLAWLRGALPEGTEPPWNHALEHGEAVHDAMLTIPQDGDEPRRARVHASPILDGQGTARGCLVTFTDETDLERANANLAAANAELEALNQQVARQNEELKQLAAIDPLTGCMNRRSFFEAAEPLFVQTQEAGGELCVLMCDIDKFKSINDTHGHGVGDLVIQQLARILKAALRPSDLLCRYGGEEFCIVLPDVNMLQAYVIAERIRFKVEAQAGPGVRSVPGLRVTSSFGLSSIGLGAPDLKALIEQADEALYHSKQTGRNKVTRFDDMMIEKAGTGADAQAATVVLNTAAGG